MIWMIAKRELFSNIITFRFLVGLILCLVLITASTFVLTMDYMVRLDSYNNNVRRHTDVVKSIKIHSQIGMMSNGADRPPSPLGFLCMGSDRELGNTIDRISYREVPREAAGQGGGNQLMNVFPSLDVTLIIQVILSLLAVLLAYDAISGERERGTLAVVLSNSVPRHHVLLGKLLGGMISITLPLVAGTLVGLLVVLIFGAIVPGSSSVALDGSAWARIGLVFLCSLLYLSAIFMMGLLVSARTRRSATSLVILLFIWVVSVMLLPNMGPYVARHLRKVEDKAVVDAKREALNSQFWHEVDELRNSLKRDGTLSRDNWKYGLYTFMSANTYSGDSPYPRIVRYAPRENMVWYMKGLEFCVPRHIEYADMIWELYRSYDEELSKQVALSDNISRISPAWTYYNAASILAGTDANAYVRLMDQARRHRQQLMDYSRAQKGFSSTAYFTTLKMDESLTFAQLVELRSQKGEAAIRELKSSYWDKAPPLRDVPIFHYQPESPAESIARALPDLFILILLNVIFFLAAYASFIRQEVK